MNPTLRNFGLLLVTALLLSISDLARADQSTPDPAKDKAAFEQAAASGWKQVFTDSGTGDWKEKWFLDGDVGTVKNTPQGLELTAGPEFKNEAHHLVLWTRESFVGDLKMEYDITRLDESKQGIILLYLQATGSGVAPYDKDIAKWNELRKVPAMETYFNHMNLYHLSFATNPGEPGYFRCRRYLPNQSGLKGTELTPEYTAEGLLAKDVTHHVTIIKKDRDLFMRISNPGEARHYRFTNAKLPPITEGRIGLRHMFTRSARYQNFRVSTPLSEAAERPVSAPAPDIEKLVAETHAASLKVRETALRKTIAKDIAWPEGVWGENLWCLAALYLNEKTDTANARLLKRAKDYIASDHSKAAATSPENPGNLPWTFFSITDYVRTLCLFHSQSPHFPGRLKPETETAMKEALWLWVRGESKLADVGADDLLLLLGTENHDLNRRPPYYLITALLKDDPAYRDRMLADGHSVTEHAAAYTKFYREWPRQRAESGLWVEMGSNTYQKYSWPALFNLHELSPDPVIRRRFGLLLDLAFIEEEQLSVQGRRGGGRSRAYPEPNAFESYKNLLYATKGQPAGSSHSRVIETSRYQLPPEAILLRYRTFPAEQPFLIRNRVLGELESPKTGDEGGQRLAADSALVNYVYRTPHYLLGSTLQNPALSQPDPKTGKPTLIYAGISRQNRACGMLFTDSTGGEICSVDAVIEHGTGGRPQHPFWSVQHENVLLLQRIAPDKLMGSYSTGYVGIGFEGKALKRVEKDGWIFASNGKAFVGVKFLDGAYQWDAKGEVATPANFDKTKDQSRILLHASDITTDGSFDKFQSSVLANALKVTADKVDYRFGPSSANRLEATRYEPKAHASFTLPLLNGKLLEVRPGKTFSSPYLNSDFGSPRLTVTVGPLKRVLDFTSEATTSASKQPRSKLRGI